MWWATWSLLHIIALHSFGFNYLQSSLDSGISNILLAGLCLFIKNNMRYYLPKNEKYWYVLFVSLTLSGLWLLCMRLSLWSIYDHDSIFMKMLTNTSLIRFAISFLLIGCSTFISLIWYAQKDQLKEKEHQSEIRNMVRDAELYKLRQQLQPHFLFNSLNSISALTKTQPDKARQMVQQLSDFLRGTLKKEDQDWISFEEEIKYLQLYLDIEKVRFGNRLQTNIHYDQEAGSLMIPTMLLQPLVENAIKFSLYDTIGDVMIKINGNSLKDKLTITIKNPFDKETSEGKIGTGFGHASVRRRLFLLFSRNDLLQVNSTADEYETVINIPQQNESHNN